MTITRTLIAAAALGFVIATPAGGEVIPVEPFEGEFSDGFDDYFAGFYDQLDMFFGGPDSGGDPNGAMVPAFLTSFSSFMGSTILARSGPHMSHMTGPVDFVFPTPVRLFGGYIATNSGASGGTVELFDAADQLIATVPLDVTFAQGTAPYTWNGWSSDTPFSRVRFTSAGTLGGFLGFDDMELSIVPAPPALLALAITGIAIRRRRRGEMEDRR